MNATSHKRDFPAAAVRYGFFIFVCLTLFAYGVSAGEPSKMPSNKGAVQAKRPAERSAKVDKEGVLRWADTGEEVALFGVNYTVPFAYSYRAIGYVGASRQQTIDQDVTHFARMGLDAFRLHMWDREITDRDGNLLDNEHMQLLDYLIYKLKSYGIYTVLTPIMGGGTGYPEPDLPTQGFSSPYTKGQLSSDPAARKLQQNYLSQLANHVNRYTGLAYKDDPAIMAFELFNEPWHRATKEEIVEYINALAKAIRDTGCRKPLFYIAGRAGAAAVRDSTVNGSTFGWYPTGLVGGRSLRGNFLPYLDCYPWMDEPELAKKAKLVYEFDAADIAGSYMYPAMARVFRSGGAQCAAMFTYEPVTIAYANTEYQTHYLNLVYTPNKAVSLMIAAEAFRRLPRLKSYGKYPKNTRFGPFRVSYEQDLSEMVTEQEFLYSNDTETKPPKVEMLERIVGCGSSAVVSYEGTGSYFLEKLKAGLWRLEVYPDAMWLDDPFETPGLDNEVCRILWRQWPMKINLPCLGQDFVVEPVNKGNTYSTKAGNGAFSIKPGVYLLRKKEVKASDYKPSMPFGRLLLGEFVVPAEKPKPTVVLHKPPREIVEDRDWQIKAEVVSSSQPAKVTLYMRRAGNRRFTSYQMQQQRGYQYSAKIPAQQIKAGLMEYYIIVRQGEQIRQFPDNVRLRVEPSDWYGHVETLWETLVVGKDAPVELFNTRRERNNLYLTSFWRAVRYKLDFVSGLNVGQLALRIDVPSFKPEPQDVSCRFAFGSEIDTRRTDIEGFKNLRIHARAGQEATSHFEISLIERDGSAWGTAVPLTTKWQQISIPLSQLRHTAVTDLPQSAPKCPTYWKKGPVGRGGKGDHLRIKNIEAVQFSFGARLFPDRADKPHAIELESIALEVSR